VVSKKRKKIQSTRGRDVNRDGVDYRVWGALRMRLSLDCFGLRDLEGWRGGESHERKMWCQLELHAHLVREGVGTLKAGEQRGKRREEFSKKGPRGGECLQKNPPALKGKKIWEKSKPRKGVCEEEEPPNVKALTQELQSR